MNKLNQLTWHCISRTAILAASVEIFDFSLEMCKLSAERELLRICNFAFGEALQEKKIIFLIQ